MRRRQFFSLLGSLATWPVMARAQQSERLHRIGVWFANPENDPEVKQEVAGFQDELAKLGWVEGRTIHIDYRFSYFSSTSLVNMKPTNSDNVRLSLAARCWSFANTLRGMMALTTTEWGLYSVHMLIQTSPSGPSLPFRNPNIADHSGNPRRDRRKRRITHGRGPQGRSGRAFQCD